MLERIGSEFYKYKVMGRSSTLTLFAFPQETRYCSEDLKMYGDLPQLTLKTVRSCNEKLHMSTSVANITTQ